MKTKLAQFFQRALRFDHSIILILFCSDSSVEPDRATALIQSGILKRIFSRQARISSNDAKGELWQNISIILVERDERIGIVTLNRAKRINALNTRL